MPFPIVTSMLKKIKSCFVDSPSVFKGADWNFFFMSFEKKLFFSKMFRGKHLFFQLVLTTIYRMFSKHSVYILVHTN